MSPETPSMVMHSVTVKPIDRTFEALETDTILAAALKGGCNLPYSCQNGVCGTCKAKILTGSIDHGDTSLAALSEAERNEGYALLCRAKPLDTLTVECAIVEQTKDIPVRKLVSRVAELERLADDVMRIRLRIAAKDKVQFLPGQYINVVMQNGIRRSLSLANVPEDSTFELHLRNYGGPFSKHVFNVLKQNDLMRLEGPLGTFFVRDKSKKPMIFVASGTGFAPVKAMIEYELSKGTERSMTLYWGGRRPADLYLNSVAEAWMRDYGVVYVPVVSDAQPEDNWNGRAGFVHRAVLDDFPDLSGHQVYACGAPIVVQSARREFVTLRNLPDDEFFADSFVPGR